MSHNKIVLRISGLCILFLNGSLSAHYVLGFVESYSLSFPDSDVSVFYRTHSFCSEAQFVISLHEYIHVEVLS